MSDRRKKVRAQNKKLAYLAAGLVHVAIIGALFVNFSTDRETVDAAFAEKIDTVKATTVEESDIKRQQNELKQKEREKKRLEEAERKRLEDLRRKAEHEKVEIADLQKKQQQEREKAQQLERERKEIALIKQREEEKRKRDEAERRKREKLAAEKRQQEREREREMDRIEQEKREMEAQQRMNELLAQEEAFLAERRAMERTTTATRQAFDLIGRKVKALRTVDPSFESWRKSVVAISVTPAGVVKSVRTIESSGSARYDEAGETAFYKASPLPMPDPVQYAEANRQMLNFEFEITNTDAR